jgi:hypothetical protein
MARDVEMITTTHMYSEIHRYLNTTVLPRVLPCYFILSTTEVSNTNTTIGCNHVETHLRRLPNRVPILVNSPSYLVAKGTAHMESTSRGHGCVPS